MKPLTHGWPTYQNLMLHTRNIQWMDDQKMYQKWKPGILQASNSWIWPTWWPTNIPKIEAAFQKHQLIDEWHIQKDKKIHSPVTHMSWTWLCWMNSSVEWCPTSDPDMISAKNCTKNKEKVISSQKVLPKLLEFAQNEKSFISGKLVIQSSNFTLRICELLEQGYNSTVHGKAHKEVNLPL